MRGMYNGGLSCKICKIPNIHVDESPTKLIHKKHVDKSLTDRVLII